MTSMTRLWELSSPLNTHKTFIQRLSNQNNYLCINTLISSYYFEPQQKQPKSAFIHINLLFIPGQQFTTKIESNITTIINIGK